MEIQTRPKRTNRVIVEETKNYTFRMPVGLMNQFQRLAHSERVSQAGALEEAITLFLRSRFQVPDTHSESGRREG
jgi:hypothetical protein